MARVDDYKRSLQESYVSECIGVELYSMLGKGPHGTSANHRQALRLLEQVETQTKETLADLIVESGDAPDQGDARVIARKINDLVGNKSWESLHAWLLDGSQQGSAVYKKIRDYAPDPEDRRIAAVLHHIDVVESIYRAEANGVSELTMAMEYLNDTRRRKVLNESESTNPPPQT